MATAQKLRILGIIGSLRAKSYNRQLMINAQQIISHMDNAEIEIFENIGQLPFVNEDKELDYCQNDDNVKRFKQSIEQSDAVLFATPEYNFSIPGVLKNAIDIGTRPGPKNSFINKAIGVMSASPGNLGGIRAQGVLRQTFFAFGPSTGYPEYILPRAGQAFDEQGKLKDAQAEKLLKSYLQQLVNLALKHKNSSPTTIKSNK
ncbi:unnamed protein product [Didymodactylos carnosus]|uniref:NADPH-dependent FMN reductase-like domain-containing protein n=1 Tax=Didymodactylos carnosus TaxID=1234261 RepID=A0A8S2S6P8_9BILA|nr:unnamed protein product [Didymodactylos carnosus]CAF4204762.1 unnamed protein product [Didymodactylos carnosus]